MGLACLKLWRLKHGKHLLPTLLVSLIAMMSATVGYATARLYSTTQPSNASTDIVGQPAPLAAMPINRAAGHPVYSMTAHELGQVQAEIDRLRLLFRQLAELAGLQDGEFDLDLGADAEPSLTSSRTNSPSHKQAFTVAKQQLTPISEQSERMHSIFQKRRQDYDGAISGKPSIEGRISSRFGYRIDPETGLRQLHNGLDFAGTTGSTIMALADGVVTYSGKNGGYGNLVELEHPNGYRTRYAHNQSLLVPVGRKVTKGQAIATMGSTGRSTGTHVHVEVRRHDMPVDPQLFIR